MCVISSHQYRISIKQNGMRQCGGDQAYIVPLNTKTITLYRHCPNSRLIIWSIAFASNSQRCYNLIWCTTNCLHHHEHISVRNVFSKIRWWTCIKYGIHFRIFVVVVVLKYGFAPLSGMVFAETFHCHKWNRAFRIDRLHFPFCNSQSNESCIRLWLE